MTKPDPGHPYNFFDAKKKLLGYLRIGPDLPLIVRVQDPETGKGRWFVYSGMSGEYHETSGPLEIHLEHLKK